MSSLSAKLSYIAVAIAAITCLCSSAHALKLAHDSVTVSGLSAGAFFSIQFQIAFSSNIYGCASIATGPYYCAQGNAETALTVCMNSPSLIPLEPLVAETQYCVSTATCDDTRDLATRKIYLFSGTLDTVVYPGVAKQTLTYLQNYVPPQNIKAVFDMAAEHAFPTKSIGNNCSYLGSPYINNCGYDAAYDMLNWIYGGNLAPGVTANSSNIVKVSQANFTPALVPPSSISMADFAFMYVPQACASGTTTCKLHISFHGCLQTLADIGQAYILNTGLNEVAEANNIVILYPQVEKSLLNPNGCFDWWGYTGVTYASRIGPQMATVNNMRNYLLSFSS